MLGKIYGFRLFTNPLKNLSDSDVAACRDPYIECPGMDKNMRQCPYAFSDDDNKLTEPSELCTYSTILAHYFYGIIQAKYKRT